MRWLIPVLVFFSAFFNTSHAEIITGQPTILITGANRGLGLEFTRQYASLGWNVIATCRTPAKADALKALSRQYPQVNIEKLDVTNDEHITDLQHQYQNQPIDILLNNAGIYGELEKQTLGSFDFEEFEQVLAVNTIAPLKMAEAFLDNIIASDGKKIISLGGGIGTQKIGRLFGGHYFFKMSKSAHLMSMRVLQKDLKKKGIIVAMISPGRVKTQMFTDSGQKGKATEPAQAAANVISVINNLDKSMAGALINYDGKIIQK